MVNNDQFKELKRRIDALCGYLKVDEKRAEIHEKELRAQDPSFWDDPNQAEVVLKQTRQLKYWVDACEELSQKLEDLQVLIEFYNSGDGDESDIDDLRSELLQKIEELELKKHVVRRRGWPKRCSSNYGWSRRDRKLRLG